MKIDSQRIIMSFGLVASLLPQMVHADNPVIKEFESPHHIMEKCIRVANPGDKRSDSVRANDQKQEEKLCNINFYDHKIALCPKTWSTSAGTIVHSLIDIPDEQAEYEKTICAKGKDHQTGKKLAAYKQTMNASGTSGTSSSSSAVYYHLSRYLNTSVTVPVAVMRTMDRLAHHERVTSAPKKPQSAMNKVAWDVLNSSEITPTNYRPTSELFTSDLSQIYGVLLRAKGERYGLEINGVRSSWGDGQNFDFQKTMPFLALKSSKPLLEAMKEGEAQADARIKAATGHPHSLQMLFWMNEITEIVLLDYLMNQQDRIGNIDYVWTWYSLDENNNLMATAEESKNARSKMGQIKKPDSLAAKDAILLQRTWIGDNDAGGRTSYVNFTKRTKMLEGIKHMNPKLYRRFIDLAKDFANSGEMFNHIKNNFFLSEQQAKMIANNAKEISEILQNNCREGKIHFDLLMSLNANSLTPSGAEVPAAEVGCN